MIEVRDDLLGVVVGVLQHGPGHADLGIREEGGEPLAVDVDAVPDDHVVLQRQTEAVTDDLHHPVDLLLAPEDAGPGLGWDSDAEVLGHRVDNTRDNLNITLTPDITLPVTCHVSRTCLPSSGGSLLRTDWVAVPRVWSCRVREDHSEYIVARELEIS